jgi:N utilization substance protein A
MSAANKQFFEAIIDLADERGLTSDEVVDSFEKALRAAFKSAKEHQSVRIEINVEERDFGVYEQFLVVDDEVGYDLKADPQYKQIKLSDAKKMKKSAKVGDVIEQKVDLTEFGPKAISNLKQVLKQNLTKYEKTNLYKYFKEKEKEMVNAQVIDFDDRFYRILLDKEVTTLLPKTEVLENDDFVEGERIKVYITSVEEQTRGPKVLVTRLDKSLVVRLFEDLIPEVKDGVVEVMGVSRNPGDRSKIGVRSTDSNVDAIGSCVGADGTRIKEIVRVLSGEKIDLFLWSDNEKDLIANSLQPAEVINVIDIDPKEKTAIAIVEDDKLSLAIGKNGQNVKLAVQAIGWKIDIKSVSMANAEGIEY